MRTSPAADELVHAGIADEGFFDNGGVHTNSGVGNKAAYLIAHGGSFYGTTVKGIGVDQDLEDLLEPRENMLPSGADYKDLGVTLSAACRNLIGKSGTGVTSAGLHAGGEGREGDADDARIRRWGSAGVGRRTARPQTRLARSCTTRASRRASTWVA